MQLRYGYIHEVGEKGRVKVRFPDADEMVSGWLQVVSQWVLETDDWNPPAMSEHVACLVDENAEAGVVLGALRHGEAPATSLWRKRFKDGTTLTYDRGSKKLTVACEGPVEVTATGDATVSATGTAHVNGAQVKLAGGGPDVARKGDQVQIQIPSGSSAGTYVGTIIGGSGKVQAG